MHNRASQPFSMCVPVDIFWTMLCQRCCCECVSNFQAIPLEDPWHKLWHLSSSQTNHFFRPSPTSPQPLWPTTPKSFALAKGRSKRSTSHFIYKANSICQPRLTFATAAWWSAQRKLQFEWPPTLVAGTWLSAACTVNMTKRQALWLWTKTSYESDWGKIRGIEFKKNMAIPLNLRKKPRVAQLFMFGPKISFVLFYSVFWAILWFKDQL